jgi:XXXCH domain-containing protein
MGVMSREQAELAEQKYRPLKKRLKKTFKRMKGWLERYELPPRSLVDEFMAETAVMVSYPGFGDEHYQDFTAACVALKKARDAKDLELFSERLTRISWLKKECHQRFK